MPKTFPVTTQIAASVVEGLVTTAFEGGSNYWYSSLAPDNADDLEGIGYWHIELPLMPGRYVTFEDLEGDEHKLDLAAIQRGLSAMAMRHPRDMADALNQEDDGDTADVFLQCCVFGKVIYG